MLAIPSLNEHALKPWFEKSDMIVACIEQVKKDVGSYGIELRVSGNPQTAYQELASQLEPQIRRLLAKGSTLQEILYRIDIDEASLNSLQSDLEPFTMALTRLILWRELQKVVTRKILSKKK